MQGILHSQSFRTACSDPYFGASVQGGSRVKYCVPRWSHQIGYVTHDSHTSRSCEKLLNLSFCDDLISLVFLLVSEALTRMFVAAVCSSQSAHVCMSSKTSTDFDTLYHSGIIPPKGGARTATGAHASETLRGIDGVYPSLDHIFWIQVSFLRRLNRSFARKTRSARFLPAVRDLTLSTSKRCFSNSRLGRAPGEVHNPLVNR
jgi:hypothetical protein